MGDNSYDIVLNTDYFVEIDKKITIEELINH
jgi:hypothetical protein